MKNPNLQKNQDALQSLADRYPDYTLLRYSGLVKFCSETKTAYLKTYRGNVQTKNGILTNEYIPVPTDATLTVNDLIEARRLYGLDRVIFLCDNTTDAFQFMDLKFQSTMAVLKHLNITWPEVVKVIQTQSDLVAHDDYLKQLNSIDKVYFKKVKELSFKKNYPGAPSLLRQEKAIQKMQRQGITAEFKVFKAATRKTAAPRGIVKTKRKPQPQVDITWYGHLGVVNG